MGDYVNFSNTEVRSWTDDSMFTLDTTWDSDGAIGPFEQASLQIRVATRENSYRFQQENEFSPWRFFALGLLPSRTGKGIERKTDEFEVIFNATVNDRLQFTTGVYFLDDVANTGGPECLNRWQAAWDPNGVNGETGRDGIAGTGDDPLGTINGKLDDSIPCTADGGLSIVFGRPGARPNGYETNVIRGESIAVFGHLNYALNDNWDLELGARWMEDARSQVALNFAIVDDACTVITPPEPVGPSELCVPSLLMNRGTVIDGGAYSVAQDTFDHVTPMISLTRSLAPGDTLDSGIVYFLASEGWLTGAFNDELNANVIEPYRSFISALIPFDPESVINYEVGFKGSFFDGRLRLSGDVFYMDYTDKQEQINVDNSDGRFGDADSINFADNVADVEISGIEFEMRAIPWEGGFVSVDLGFLNNKYSKYTVPDVNSPTGTIDLTDVRIQSETPDWSLTAAISHAFQLGNGATLTPRLGVYVADEYEWLSGFAFGSPGLLESEISGICHQDGYSTWRARLTYVPPGGTWQASLYGNNITDERILEACGNNRTGARRFGLAPPKWWGVEFEMRFGAGQ